MRAVQLLTNDKIQERNSTSGLANSVNVLDVIVRLEQGKG